MFDVFYSGIKPNLFAHEQAADSIEQAQELSKTRYFWWINYLSEYTGFDFSFEPKPWEAQYTHTWPSQHHEYSGTFLVPKTGDIQYKFHTRVIPNKDQHLKYTKLAQNVMFDYTWAPHPFDPPFIYVFGNQHYPANIMPTIEYHVDGAIERKFMTAPRVTLLPQHTSHWKQLAKCQFDYSWQPDPGDPPYIYVFGNQHHRAEIMPTVEYHADGATERKFMSYPRAQLLKDTTQWTVPEGIDTTSIDYTWVPDPGDPPYIYQFGTQHQQTSGPHYKTPGATEIKYVTVFRTHTNTINIERWVTPDDVTDFDYSWHPDDRDPPYIYQFGTQHQATGGPRYVVLGATEIKYVATPRATTNKINTDLWITPNSITDFDYTWHPDDRDPPYIYQFGTQHQATGGPQYVVPGATEIKYVPLPRATIDTEISNYWVTPDDVTDFDYTWHPDDRDPPYIYQFGTQHQATGGPQYVVPGATEIKYVPTPRAKRTIVDDCWTIPENTNQAAFDFTWHPDSRDTPYIYQFATQWNRAGGPTYTVPGATEIKYVTAPIARMLPTDKNWQIPKGIDVNSFDFSWTPDSTEQPFIYEFGTQWQKTGGPRYIVPGATEIKYVTTPRATRTAIDSNWTSPDNIADFDYTWHPDSTETPFIYQFGTQWQKTGGPTYTVSGATTIKYISAPRANKTSTDDNWIIPNEADVSTFDWTWHPDSTDAPYIYQFGTQHQRTGGPQYHVPGATDTKYVDQLKIKTERVAMAIYEIDHMDGNAGKVPDAVKTVRYFDNYLDTLKRIAKNIPPEQEFIWICSSVCDYTDFDFTWHPEVWQASMLHVFPSNGEKFGDTFFMHVPTFQYRAEKCQLLEWYDLNFMDVSVPRRPLPVVQHSNDTHVEAMKTMDWRGPLAIFSVGDAPTTVPTVPLWREKTKTIVPLSQGASNVIVPKVAIPYIKTQAYDYPHIDKTHKTGKEQLLDIVFIDNGEPEADYNYHHLCWANRRATNSLIHRSTGVNGRVAAYRAAAEKSTTPWFFAVFAKLEINPGFDWTWQPDRLQEPKHYIFHAYNPVNELVYGHQAMIAYNKKLVLENTAPGLDFTLDQAHEVVPILSGMANYHRDSWTCWRTAFREVIKLKASLPNVENEWRLTQWLTMDNTDDKWSMKGAEDAVEYYDAVKGEFSELKKSYDWQWLASYAFMKRSLPPSQ